MSCSVRACYFCVRFSLAFQRKDAAAQTTQTTQTTSERCKSPETTLIASIRQHTSPVAETTDTERQDAGANDLTAAPAGPKDRNSQLASQPQSRMGGKMLLHLRPHAAPDDQGDGGFTLR